MKLGVTEYVDCAHFLPGHPKCGPMHGHTYKVEVTVQGQPKDGMIIDFGDLKLIVRDALAHYDHHSWKDFLEYPSVENICELLSVKLRDRLSFPFTRPKDRPWAMNRMNLFTAAERGNPLFGFGRRDCRRHPWRLSAGGRIEAEDHGRHDGP
jgi:6-pyruvoyltetrahydropterin/6-carboxytetrahydropterin synthase